MYWANFLHIYQPPTTKDSMIERVVNEAYRPLIKVLKNSPQARLTLNIAGCLTERLIKRGNQDVIADFKELVEKGQIELTGSSAYHAFLPLLPSAEIKRQIELNERINEKYFGKLYQPSGFYSPEAGFSLKVAKVAAKLGFSWMIVDEIGFSGKLSKRGYDFSQTPGFYSGGLKLQEIVGEVTGERLEREIINYGKTYQLKGVKNFALFFRERVISDALASGEISSAEQFLELIRPELAENRYLLTGTDGEAYGHHQPSLIPTLFGLLQAKELKPIFISEIPQHFRESLQVKPYSCSWGTTEKEIKERNFFARWLDPQNEIHRFQWQLTALALESVKKNGLSQPARRHLDMALYSCHYWWASARPWWSIELIENGARELLRVVERLPSRERKKYYPPARQLYEKIVFTAFDWLRTGKVEDLSHTHK